MAHQGHTDRNLKHLEDWLAIVDVSSYYELLGVLAVADDTAIRDAFHRFSAAFHPDQHREDDEETQRRCRFLFMRGAEAYRVLRDPILRARYDLCLAQGKLRLEGSQATEGGTALSLSDLCETPAGRLHARHAEEHLDRGELSTALRSLSEAAQAEGRNPRLDERIDALRQFLSLVPPKAEGNLK